MTKTIDEMVAVMLAARDGKKIQFLAIRNSEGQPLLNMEWRDWGPNPFQWDWIRFDYRVKPEPRRIYVNEYRSGLANVYNTCKLDLQVSGKKDAEYVRTLTFVEELE